MGDKVRQTLADLEPGLRLELTQEFIKQVKTLLPAMRAALAQGEFRMARLHAHTLKGSARIFGDPRCVSAAERLERHFADEPGEGAELLLSDLQTELSRLIDELTGD